MTTKRWLLDLIDVAEELARKHMRDALEYGDPAVMTAARTHYSIELGTIERARQLVEKGPDEP